MSTMLKLRALFALSAGMIIAALAGSATAGASPAPTLSPTVAPSPASTQGIIMSDGRICNPRWGC